MEAQRTSVSNDIYLAHFNNTEIVSKWWRNVLDRDMVKQGGDLFQIVVESLAWLVFVSSNCTISIN